MSKYGVLTNILIATFCIVANMHQAFCFTWAVDSTGKGLYKSDASTPWTTVTPITGALFKQIVVGHNGAVWALTNEPIAGGFKLYIKSGINGTYSSSDTWTNIPAGLVQISVGRNGILWGVNDAGTIFVRDGITATVPAGTTWVGIDGKAKNIAGAPNGIVYCVGVDGFAYVRTGITESNLRGTTWVAMPNIAQVEKITAGPQGVIWCIGAQGLVYATVVTDPTQLSGAWAIVSNPVGSMMKEISLGHDGSAWGIDTTGKYYMKTGVSSQNGVGGNWTQVTN